MLIYVYVSNKNIIQKYFVNFQGVCKSFKGNLKDKVSMQSKQRLVYHLEQRFSTYRSRFNIGPR